MGFSEVKLKPSRCYLNSATIIIFYCVFLYFIKTKGSGVRGGVVAGTDEGEQAKWVGTFLGRSGRQGWAGKGNGRAGG